VVGANDEYFHNGSNQLLSDRGVDSLTTVGSYPEDDYIWLGGRPVAVVRGKFNANDMEPTLGFHGRLHAQ
jgi:hypothetical protein